MGPLDGILPLVDRYGLPLLMLTGLAIALMPRVKLLVTGAHASQLEKDIAYREALRVEAMEQLAEERRARRAAELAAEKSADALADTLRLTRGIVIGEFDDRPGNTPRKRG